MTDQEKAEIIIRLEQVNDTLQKNRIPFYDGHQMIVNKPTLAEWAIEETVCALLDMLESVK